MSEKEEQAALDEECLKMIGDTLQRLRFCKPDDRGELARQYTITITELEKAYAYFNTYVHMGEGR